MKRFLSILLLFLSALVTASPIMEWSCTEELMICSMDTDETASCCSTQDIVATTDINCCTVNSRVPLSATAFKAQETSVVQKTKASQIIKTKWFHSNYLEPLQNVDLTSVKPLTTAISGFKFKDIELLSYICVYRI